MRIVAERQTRDIQSMPFMPCIRYIVKQTLVVMIRIAVQISRWSLSFQHLYSPLQIDVDEQIIQRTVGDSVYASADICHLLLCGRLSATALPLVSARLVSREDR